LAAAALVGGQGSLEAVDERVQAGSEPFVAVVGPYVLAEGGQHGEAAGSSDRRNACRSRLVAVSWMRCSLVVVRSLSAKPRV